MKSKRPLIDTSKRLQKKTKHPKLKPFEKGETKSRQNGNFILFSLVVVFST